MAGYCTSVRPYDHENMAAHPNAAARCFRISITDDGNPEGTEQFTISFVVDLVDPGIATARVMSNPVQATIFIQDNDGKLYTTWPV